MVHKGTWDSMQTQIISGIALAHIRNRMKWRILEVMSQNEKKNLAEFVLF